MSSASMPRKQHLSLSNKESNKSIVIPMFLVVVQHQKELT
jgi:hypothetical protein